MTTTPRDYRTVNVPRRSHAPRPRGNRRQIIYALAVASCLVTGMAAVALSYAIAQYHLTTQSEFIWFWVGMFLLTLPLVVVMARRATTPALRIALLTIYAIVTYAPKLLRDPFSPLYNDEFGHWRATYEILQTGKLFKPNPIVWIAQYYPGMDAATAAIVHATGLDIWQAATILLLLCHIFLVLGIAALAEGLGVSSRTAALASVIYSLNSSFLYFDTEFAYESMGITLAVWTLVAYVRAVSPRPSRERRASCFITLMFSAGCVITHHLSALSLIAIMAVVALGLSLPGLARRGPWIRNAVTAWALTLATGMIAAFWFIVIAPGTLSYLSPYISQGLSQLMQDAHGASSAKQLFSASLNPGWEQTSSYLVVLFALAITILGVLLLISEMRRRRLPAGHRRALWVSFSAWGLVYFPSVLFILSSAGSEGARRSWAFTWIGLAIAAAPPAGWLLDYAERQNSRLSRTSLRTALTVAFAVGMIGGTANGVDVAYRFPGPYLYGSDTRDVTPELIAASAWFKDQFGPGNNIITDRYTGQIFASYGAQNPGIVWSGFPAYELFLAPPSSSSTMKSLLTELQDADYKYVIVDRRMAYFYPEIGIYFDPGEPSAVPNGGKSPFYGKLQRLNSWPWLVKVFQSDNYSVYRLSLPVQITGYGRRPPVKQGKLEITP
jgi:hypothetical protein